MAFEGHTTGFNHGSGTYPDPQGDGGIEFDSLNGVPIFQDPAQYGEHGVTAEEYSTTPIEDINELSRRLWFLNDAAYRQRVICMFSEYWQPSPILLSPVKLTPRTQRPQ
jgi:hypothetical protein